MGYENTAGVEPAAESSSTNQDTQKLLRALWRSPDLVHQIGVLHRPGGGFNNIPIQEGGDVIAGVLPFLATNLDVYFAVAEYTSPDNRTAKNAAGAWALWLDIDVAPDKAASRKGYSSVEEAKDALFVFCASARIPLPTHLVESGSGLHAYWVLSIFLPRAAWQSVAQRFKRITQVLGLHADPSRTADISSVLRLPGTLNHKSDPPKPVTLVAATDHLIDTDAMDAAIQAAIEQHYCGAVDFDQRGESAPVSAPSIDGGESIIEPPNLEQLASALKALDPDCDEKTWKLYRIGPMAYTARVMPEIADRLHKLAREWSSGDLRGLPSKKWQAPGITGLSGKQMFGRVWKRFLTDNYTGKRVTLGSIFFHAKELGWVYSPEQSQSDNADGRDEA